MEKRSVKLVHDITNSVYVLVSIILFAIAFIIIIWSLWQMIADVIQAAPSSNGLRIYKIMDEVAYIVFAIAVADVARYLLVEEVLTGRDNKPDSERRKALSNLILIISTAFSLEGLILTIQVAKSQMEHLVYPILLLVVSALMLIALGVYQKLSPSAKE